MHLGTALLLLAAAAAATATRPLQTRRLLELPPLLPTEQAEATCAASPRDTAKEDEYGTIRSSNWCINLKNYCKDYKHYSCGSGTHCVYSFHFENGLEEEEKVECIPDGSSGPEQPPEQPANPCQGVTGNKCHIDTYYCKDEALLQCPIGTRCAPLDNSNNAQGIACVPDTPTPPGQPAANPCESSTQDHCISQTSYCKDQRVVLCAAGAHCSAQAIGCLPDTPTPPEQPAANPCESSTQDHCISETTYCKGRQLNTCSTGQHCNWSQQGIGCQPSGTNPGTNPGTGTNPPTNPGTNPGTNPPTNPGTNPGTNPPTNPGINPSEPGTGPGPNPPTTPGTGPNPSTGTNPTNPCASSTKDQCLQVGIVQFYCLGTQAWMCPPGSTCTTGSDGKPFCNSVWGSGRVAAVPISDLRAASNLTTLPGGSASGIAGSSGASAIAGATASALPGGG